MDKQLTEISDHYVICGFNKISRGICHKLKEVNIPFIIVDESVEALEYSNMRDYLIVNDDPTNDATLIAAGIERSLGIVACTGNDSNNLYITLAARELHSTMHIITCSSDPSKEERMLRAGANKVVYPEYLGGEQIANIVTKNLAVPGLVENKYSLTSILGYSLQIYEHYDESDISLDEIIQKTSAVKIVGIVRNTEMFYTDLESIELQRNDIVVVAVKDKNTEKKPLKQIELLKWSSAFSVGIVSIDKEHKNIVDLTNRLTLAIVNGELNQVMSQLFDELLDYTLQHFSHEEILFEKHNYPDKEAHTQLHKYIVDKVKSLGSQSQFVHPESLSEFLKMWIKHHFGVIDQQYSQFLIDKGVK